MDSNLATHDALEPVLTLSELAARLSVSVQTLYDLRSKGRGPRGFRIGRELRFRPRQAEAYHHDLEQLPPRIVAAHPLDDAEDIAAVLRYRIETSAGTSPRGLRWRQPRLIAGLIPEPVGPMDDEHHLALDQRKELIECRARALAEETVEATASWTKQLGAEPADRDQVGRWLTAVSTVAAYRDRYAVTSAQPLGAPARTDSQQSERLRAGQAARQAQRIAAEGDARNPQTLVADPLAIG